MNWLDRFQLPGKPLFVETMAWPDLEAIRGDVLLLPIGATEQHGPHLPVNTDSVIATAVCAYASAKTGAPILPTLNYSVSIGHTEKWPGSFALFHETLMRTVREIAAWAVASGWKRLLLINGHCGNDAALRCAVDRLRFDFVNRLLVAIRNTWQLTAEIARSFTLDAVDWHANEAETSLMLFLAPETVRTDRIAGAVDPDRTGNCIFPHMVAHTSLNGVTGNPSEATREKGAALIQQMGDALAVLIESARIETAPLAWHRTEPSFS